MGINRDILHLKSLQNLDVIRASWGITRAHFTNIVKYLGTHRDKHRMYIFLEYCSGGSVASVLKKFNMSLGNGLSKLAGKVFRTGHLGDFNDLMLLGTLTGVEMGL